MHRETFEKNCPQLKRKVREKWSKFTDEEIAKLQGKYEEFLGLLEMKYGLTKEQAVFQVQSWNEEHIKKEYTGVTRFWDPSRHPPKPTKPDLRKRSKAVKVKNTAKRKSKKS